MDEKSKRRGGKRKGAGRNPVFESRKRQRSVSLSPQAWSMVEKLAARLNMSINAALEYIIRAFGRRASDEINDGEKKPPIE